MDPIDAGDLRRSLLKRKRIEATSTIGESLGISAITIPDFEVIPIDPQEVAPLVASKHS